MIGDLLESVLLLCLLSLVAVSVAVLGMLKAFVSLSLWLLRWSVILSLLAVSAAVWMVKVPFRLRRVART